MLSFLQAQQPATDTPRDHDSAGVGRFCGTQSDQTTAARSFPTAPRDDSHGLGHRVEPTHADGDDTFYAVGQRGLASVSAIIADGFGGSCNAGRDEPAEFRGSAAPVEADFALAAVDTHGRKIRARPGAEIRAVTLALVRFYQACISPLLPSSCRYYPSCSVYAYDAIEGWGVKRGLRMALGRLLRCRPFGGYGYDPVPEPVGGDQELIGAQTRTPERRARVTPSEHGALGAGN
jgi:uncharacterized protein